MANKRIRAIIVCDSRGKVFLEKEPLNKEIYTTHNIVIRGGNIEQLQKETVIRLRSLPKEDICMLQISAGINEITKKIQHGLGCELSLNYEQNLWQNIIDFKENIRTKYPSTLVSISTVPIVDLKAANAYYLQRGWLKCMYQTEQELTELQTNLRDTLTDINHKISEENKKNQPIPQIGLVRPTQLYLHQDIERTFTRKKKNGTRKTTKHIRIDSLCDGIHPSDDVAQKWFSQTHCNLLKQAHKLCFPDEYQGT